MKTPVIFGVLAAVAVLSILANRADAEVVAQATGQTGSILQLHNDAGVCTAPAKRAVFINNKNEPMQGCYAIDDGTVYIVLLNAMSVELPIQVFKPPTKL